MEGLFIVKSIIPLDPIQSKTSGQVLNKKQVVLASREPRVGESGIYTLDQEFVLDLIGEAADNFNYSQNDFIAATLYFRAKEFEGRVFQEIKLVRHKDPHPNPLPVRARE